MVPSSNGCEPTCSAKQCCRCPQSRPIQALGEAELPIDSQFMILIESWPGIADCIDQTFQASSAEDAYPRRFTAAPPERCARFVKTNEFPIRGGVKPQNTRPRQQTKVGASGV